MESLPDKVWHLLMDKFDKLLLVILISLSWILLPQTSFAKATLTKRVEVDLTHQRLYAFQNNVLIYNFPISSGTLIHPTVTGTFYPWGKYLYYEMIGGSKKNGDYYDLPNVPYVVYFYRGYAIHGTYWHHNFGHPMSHGCVNLQIEDAKRLYFWINYSTPITIYGITPSS
jgi:lipoprotein-anchoring transpeptidase ErfK/SrfK